VPYVDTALARLYNADVVAPYTGNRKGGIIIDLCTFIVSVMASVIAYYICKWLDGDDHRDN